MKKLHIFLILFSITFPCIAQAQADTASNSPEDDCFPQGHPDYPEWVLVGKPACWCYLRQCRGDADGIQTGPFWVGMPDLNAFVAAFNKLDAMLPPDGICADFDHTKTGPFRVGMLDLNIFIEYFNKLESQVPPCIGWWIPWPWP
ncbi:MAG: hypothetical protein ACYTDW_10485 [Planctomycetota bacterium]